MIEIVPMKIYSGEYADVCIWKRTSNLTEYWDTSCGHSHLFFEGSPDSNEYIFCPYCGKLIQEEE